MLNIYMAKIYTFTAGLQYMLDLFTHSTQGSQLNDSVLGVTTPGRYRYTGGVYYYENLNTTEPQSTVMRESQLGLTRLHTTRARVDDDLDIPLSDPLNVPNVDDSQYGKNVGGV